MKELKPRSIVIRYADGFPRQEEPVCGIYRIIVGDCFYIGRSVDIKRRASQHFKEINAILKLPEVIPNHYMGKVRDYLLSNPAIKKIYFELLEGCSSDTINECEQVWFDKFNGDDKCLNFGFVSKPSSYDVRIANGN